MNRRACLSILAAAALSIRDLDAQTAPATDPQQDWVCPMHPDYRSSSPGTCPRCGMKLVLGIPERLDFSIEVTHSPAVMRPAENATLRLRVFDPTDRALERRFQIVHEKLMHVFIVSENLEYFAHLHPTLQSDGVFELPLCLPQAGMYRLLADFYPSGSVPQLAVATIFVTGEKSAAHLVPELAPSKAANLTATLRLDPDQLLAGFETRLNFTLDPPDGIERYLGAWAHMLVASADLIDLIHLHPFLTDERRHMQFNVIFPRSGLYRVWTQFQRLGIVNTTRFTLSVA
jgi:hypothetical protein